MIEEIKAQVGQEVIVFKDYKWSNSLRLQFASKGTVVEVSETDDLSYHGSPYYRQEYVIELEEENGTTTRISAGYRYPLYRWNPHFILSKEDYASGIEREIKEANNRIQQLKDEVDVLEKELENYKWKMETKVSFFIAGI